MKKFISVSYLSIKPILLLIFPVIFIGLIFNGCTRHGAFSARKIAYTDTIPYTVKLSDYKAIQVNVTSIINNSDKCCGILQDKITELLAKKKFFETILKGNRGKEEESRDMPADLQLNTEIVALTKSDVLDRILIDRVGGAKIVVVNRLKDLKTGKELGGFTAKSQYGSDTIGALFGIGTTKHVIKGVAKKIVKYIKTHM